MAYVLGFIAADGNICRNKRGANFFTLQITDKDILYEIRRVLGSDHRISEKRVSPKHQTRYRLQIGSKEMCDDLRILGMKENKTFTMVLPKVPEKYLFDFVRGYFDGDGNVWVGKMNKDRKTPHYAIQTVFTSYSRDFLEGLKKRLEHHSIKGGLSCKKGFSRLYYSINGSNELYRLMYHGQVKELFLPRKKIVFEKFKKLQR